MTTEASCSWEVQGEAQENSKEVSLNVPPYEKTPGLNLIVILAGASALGACTNFDDGLLSLKLWSPKPQCQMALVAKIRVLY